jgi:hypothetical protein
MMTSTQFQSLLHVTANYPQKDIPLLQVPTTSQKTDTSPRSPSHEDSTNQHYNKIITTTQGDGGKICAFHPYKLSTLMIYIDNELILQVEEVVEYTLVPVSNLFDKKTVLVCICQPAQQKRILQTYLLDGDSYTAYQLFTQFELPTDLCESNTQSNQNLEAENVSLVYQTFNNGMLSSSESHLCLYSPSRHSLHVWNISLNSVISTSDITTAVSYTCKMSHLFHVDVFATVFCLRMTNTHIVLGKMNCIHIYNWKYVNKRRENLITEVKSNEIKKNTTDINDDEVIKKERLGRCIYLPRASKTKRNLNKVFDDVKSQETQARIKSPLETGEEKVSKIVQKENEKVIDIKQFMNSKFLVRSNAGNLYALDCMMPYDKDSFTRLNFPVPFFERVCCLLLFSDK